MSLVAPRNHLGRLVLLATGIVLLAITPVVAPIPGPGGVFTFAGGATLLLRNSYWARRCYVRMERRWPRVGAWANWALRRRARSDARRGRDEAPIDLARPSPYRLAPRKAARRGGPFAVDLRYDR